MPDPHDASGLHLQGIVIVFKGFSMFLMKKKHFGKSFDFNVLLKNMPCAKWCAPVVEGRADPQWLPGCGIRFIRTLPIFSESTNPA